jgi:hypothetical protein
MSNIDRWKKPEGRASTFKRRRKESDQPYLESMLTRLDEPDGRLLQSWHHEVLSHTYFFGVAYPVLERAKSQLEIVAVEWNISAYECKFCGKPSQAQRKEDVQHNETCAIWMITEFLKEPFGPDVS